MNPRKIPTLPAIGALTLIYLVAGKLSLSLAFVNKSASPVWPPTGIALAALLILGIRVWPAIFAGAFIVNLWTTSSVLASVGIAGGNTLEAICAAWLINRFANGTNVFDRAQDVFKFAVITLASAALSASIGVTTLSLTGLAQWANYSTIWKTWWLGDYTGALIVTPLVVLWLLGCARKWTKRELIEVTSLFVLLIGLGLFLFSGWFSYTAQNYPVSFLQGPIVIWMAFRFTPRETITGMFILTSMAIWGTLHGHGPFVMTDENQALAILDARTIVNAITVLALSAAIAERDRSREALEQQKDEVESANRTKDNFLAMLSHELRTPLTPVLAALDSLDNDGVSSSESRNSLAMIRRNVELESQLIDDLLDLTRIAKDKLQLRFGPLDAHEVVQNVVEICRPEAQARSLKVHVNLRAGAHHVTGDAAKFQQIIWNLLKNAIKFTADNGEITMSTTNPEPQLVAISVHDTGIGIDPEIMNRIFDPFEQGERSFQRRYGGLGLGLAISKSLAQAHGGTLIARSAGPGRGSTFTLTIKTVPPTAKLAKLASSIPQTRPLRILLVDDHQDTCIALERLLVRRGHLVAAAHNIRSAMEAAARNSFDLLISDIALPDGTGTELMTYLRAMSQTPGIAISGFGMNGDVQKSLDAGFIEHLVKPVKMESLEAAIDRVMATTSL
ncbi:MAG TPA: MASE1 domain-containing protein [Chthoniobacterales bacterium]|jgi:signal transduction histidine kinase|nr:MASE1 domain-containing protein [Chthoniobacterales bacterium]